MRRVLLITTPIPMRKKQAPRNILSLLNSTQISSLQPGHHGHNLGTPAPLSTTNKQAASPRTSYLTWPQPCHYYQVMEARPRTNYRVSALRPTSVLSPTRRRLTKPTLSQTFPTCLSDQAVNRTDLCMRLAPMYTLAQRTRSTQTRLD